MPRSTVLEANEGCLKKYKQVLKDTKHDRFAKNQEMKDLVNTNIDQRLNNILGESFFRLDTIYKSTAN